MTPGSEEEEVDILNAYQEHEGDLEKIFSAIPCSNILEDEKRFIDIIDSAIQENKVVKTKKWASMQGPKGNKFRQALRSKAKKEANEAEQYAKELGVWDDLFGQGKSKGKASMKRKKENTNTENKQRKQDDDDEDVNLDALRAAMQAKAKKRESSFDDMITRLEKKHSQQPSKRKKKSS